MQSTETGAKPKKVRVINPGNPKVVSLTKEAQGTMYYRAE